MEKQKKSINPNSCDYSQLRYRFRILVKLPKITLLHMARQTHVRRESLTLLPDVSWVCGVEILIGTLEELNPFRKTFALRMGRSIVWTCASFPNRASTVSWLDVCFVCMCVSVVVETSLPGSQVTTDTGRANRMVFKLDQQAIVL